MMRWTGCRQAAFFCLGMLVCSPFGGAKAQIPIPVPSEPAEINACVCLQAASAALAGEKDAKAQALTALDKQLADLNAQLDAEKPRVDVNSTASVSQYKVLLERRDATRAQIGPAQAAKAGGKKSFANLEGGKALGREVAEKAKAAGVTQVVFDRSGYPYHGVLKAVAEAAREAGLKF